MYVCVHAVNRKPNGLLLLFFRYLSLQAAEPLDMEDSVRMDVENRICDDRGPRADSFLRPQLVVFHTMKEVQILSGFMNL